MQKTLLKLNSEIKSIDLELFQQYSVLNLSKNNKIFKYFSNLTTPCYPMQTWNWACEFWMPEKMSVNGHEAFLINVFQEETKIWVQAVIYQYPWHFNQVFLTVPRGPVFSTNFSQAPEHIQVEVLKSWNYILQQLIQQTKAVFVKIESTWDGDTEMNLTNSNNESAVADLKYDLAVKVRQNFDNKSVETQTKFLQPPYSRTIQTWNKEWLSDPDVEYKQSFQKYFDIYFESVLQTFESKTRYNARLGLKKNLEVTWDKTEDDFEHFWKIMQTTADRQKFKPYSRKYYQNVFKNDWAQLALVKTAQGQVINAWMGSFLAGMGMYLYGGSDTDFGSLKGAELIHTAAIIRCIQGGNRYYDMGGTSLLDGAIPAWDGYSKFKKGFGGKIVEYLPHTYDYMARPRVYKAVNLAISTAKNAKMLIRR
jgi:lipid II:glycine glycyltransferase (peptidoglycan interpeptide bridge formation enzyme)